MEHTDAFVLTLNFIIVLSKQLQSRTLYLRVVSFISMKKHWMLGWKIHTLFKQSVHAFVGGSTRAIVWRTGMRYPTQPVNAQAARCVWHRRFV